MRNKWLSWAWSLALGLCLVMPLRAAAQETSTPEERARWVEISHKLESNPLDESVNKDGESALNRLSSVHDVRVPLCSALLGQFVYPGANLFVSQSDHRIDAHCSPGWSDTCQSRDAAQNQGGDGKREGIEGLHAVEKLLHKACEAP